MTSLIEYTEMTTEEYDAASFAALAAQKRAHLHALMRAPMEVREAALEASAPLAAAYYATPEGEAELADWRALQGEPFHD